MSGIFGILGPTDGACIENMRQSLRHRGKDAAEIPLPNGGFIGAVAGVPTNSVCTSGSLAIAISGDIFNLPELSGSVSDLRSETKFDSVAEVVLAVYKKFGAEGIERIVGNFAFVVVNLQNGEVIFGRDFFGIAPLFYAMLDDGTPIFASEYKALLVVDGFNPNVDVDMLQYLQHSKKLPIGKTLFASIRSPLPGTISQINVSGEAVSAHSFRELSVKVEARSEAGTMEMLRHELTEALRRNTQESGNIGLALSGGIDSIGLAFLLRKIYPDRQIHTFSAGSDQEDGELRTAALVANAMGSIHHEVHTPPEMVNDCFRDVVWHLEDPYARSEVPQLFEIGRRAKGHVDVLLSGQGADSLFAGMPRYRLLWLIKTVPVFRGALEEFYNRTQYGVTPMTFVGKLLNAMYYRGTPPAVPSIKNSSYTVSPAPFPPVTFDFINRMMAKGFQYGQSQDAMKYERSFAASGIKYRLPFSDLDFTRFAYTIDDSLKIRFRQNKYVLRKAFAGTVPAEFLEIPKFAQRARCDNEFCDMLDLLKDDLFSKEATLSRGFFDYQELNSLFSRDADRPYNDEISMRLWTAIATELWAKIFLDGAIDKAGAISENRDQ